MILAALPIVVAGYMCIVRPDYVGILLTEPVGLMMLAVGVVMLGIGMLWMDRSRRSSCDRAPGGPGVRARRGFLPKAVTILGL